MRFTSAVAAAAAVAPLVAAHDGPRMPKISGINMKELKARGFFEKINARVAELTAETEKRGQVETRQVGGTSGTCGAGVGSCAAGYCCSPSGYCGNTGDYCYSPGCQYAYGPGCPENATPAGADTSTIARTKVGNVDYGGDGIYGCVNNGDIALTFDDGPLQDYTDHILSIFKSYNAVGTFFITGNNINKGQIDITPAHVNTIKNMYAAGHQLASHTWTHLDLSAISAADRKSQMIKNEMALRNIVGKIPTYMRPPYSSCTAASGCEADMATLGYHVTYFNVDTDDYDQDAANLIQNAKNNFKGNITAGGAKPSTNSFLSIAHDIHYQTAYNLTDFMLSTLTGLGYKPVTVGTCLGDPVANWYRDAGTGTTTGTTPSPSAGTSKTVSTDATCGGTKGYTCQGSTFGSCCSVSGWCGSTDAYCGSGCQSGFGTCTGTGTAASPSSAKAATPSPSPVTAAKVSTDATCGGTKGYTCKGSTFGSCCSQNGWCGSTDAYCGSGCQSGFGTCTGTGTAASPSPVKATTPSPSPAAAAKVSTDATCGGTGKFTCKGSGFGDCCSSAGWCGSSSAYCGSGCQKAFGTCT